MSQIILQYWSKCDACDALQDLEVVGVGFAEGEAGGVFGGDGKIMVISCFWFKWGPELEGLRSEAVRKKMEVEGVWWSGRRCAAFLCEMSEKIVGV